MGTKVQEPAVEAELTVEERLDKLEKSARRWRFTSLGLFLGLAGLSAVFGWTQVRIAGVVRAQRFEIVHDKGIALELAHAEREREGLAHIVRGVALLVTEGVGKGVVRQRHGLAGDGVGDMDLQLVLHQHPEPVAH